jgi:hypothetical protein
MLRPFAYSGKPGGFMATWVAHFRLAEALLERGLNVDRRSFLVGNIAPDSGVLNADKTGYEPSGEISHWHGDQREIQFERFYADHLAQKAFPSDEYAFRLGYYCHLLADHIWTETVWTPKKVTPLYAEPLANDRQFIWEIKKDWYGLDFLYLNEHPQSIFYTDFIHIESVPDYIDDIFPAGAFTKRVKDTQAFYLNPSSWELDRPYTYLNRQEWDDYVALSLRSIHEALIEKGVMA